MQLSWTKATRAVSLGLLCAMFASAQAGCGGEKKICVEAAEKYTQCVEQILGKEMADMARSKSKAGIKACSEDSRTQKMYEKCMPEKDCEAFMDCTMAYAAAEGP